MAVNLAHPERPCRLCAAPLRHVLVDLGNQPLANSYLAAADLDHMEPTYPLVPRVCSQCFLVQLPEFASPAQIFSEYAYFSSYSDSALRHASTFAAEAQERLRLDSGSLVVEVASNDGYLLRFFRERGIGVLGIEPAQNVARAAAQAGIPTITEFFHAGTAGQLAAKGTRADLLVANNVLAHVPDLAGFVAGFKTLLAPHGALSVEFPHLLRLLEENQFDTIYHEHFSYFSLHTASVALARRGLRVFDVEEIPTHGGSLRVWAGHPDDATKRVHPRVQDLLDREAEAGLQSLGTYAAFGSRVAATKRSLLRFLIDSREAGAHVAAYGAPAKGNTLLNFCGVGTDLLDYTVDRSPHKQGRFLPGSRIPIHAPEKVAETRPDYLLILPWNLKQEIMAQMAGIRDWGCRFVVPVPETHVLA